MGTKIYQSAMDSNSLLAYDKLFPMSELNILISYALRNPDYYHLIKWKESHLSSSFICDSGTFTANFAKNNSGSNITLDGFISFCKQKPIYESFDIIFNYDENFNIDGFETNLRNMKKLEDNGIAVVPVVHDYKGVHFDEIGYYIQKNYPIIALGYSEHKMKDKKMNITNAVNRIVKAGRKVHLLGISNFDILADIPVHYCDSSSWLQHVNFGNVLWWNPHLQKTDKTDIIAFLDRENSVQTHNKHIGNYRFLTEFKNYIKEHFNFSLNDLYGFKRVLNRRLINMHFYVQLQNEVRKAHEKRGFKMN